MQKFRLAVALATSLFSGLAGVACSPAAPPPSTGGTRGGGTGGGTSAGNGGSGSATGGSSGGATGGSSGSGGATMTGGTSGGGASGRGGTGGGSTGTGGTGTGGSAGTGGTMGGAGGTTATDARAPDATAGDGGGSTEKFSFFYTSLDGMRRLSKSPNGFGGDLRFGEATGLEGADKICQTLAADVGFGNKTWRAFLSAVKGPDGMQVNAIDRIGMGPWYDRRGRVIAMNRAGLVGAGDRPVGDATAVNDLPDETGQGTKRLGDTHDVMTGSNTKGELRTPGVLANTCMDWTSATARGVIQMGHAWPAGSGTHWIQVHTEGSCAAGVNLVQTGPGNGTSIGAGGGWGGYYCFALTP